MSETSNSIALNYLNQLLTLPCSTPFKSFLNSIDTQLAEEYLAKIKALLLTALIEQQKKFKVTDLAKLNNILMNYVRSIAKYLCSYPLLTDTYSVSDAILRDWLSQRTRWEKRYLSESRAFIITLINLCTPEQYKALANIQNLSRTIHQSSVLDEKLEKITKQLSTLEKSLNQEIENNEQLKTSNQAQTKVLKKANATIAEQTNKLQNLNKQLAEITVRWENTEAACLRAEADLNKSHQTLIDERNTALARAEAAEAATDRALTSAVSLKTTYSALAQQAKCDAAIAKAHIEKLEQEKQALELKISQLQLKIKNLEIRNLQRDTEYTKLKRKNNKICKRLDKLEIQTTKRTTSTMSFLKETRKSAEPKEIELGTYQPKPSTPIRIPKSSNQDQSYRRCYISLTP